MNLLMDLWQVQEMRTALLVGSTVAIATACIGVLTVLRGQSFAGHSLTDLASVGGSAAYLLGINQLWGFLVASVLAGLGMHAIGIERIRGRDVATGIVLATGMGFTSLFITLSMTGKSGGSAAVAVLFGSLFAINPQTVPLICLLAVVSIVAMALIWRPALFVTVSPQLAHANGVRNGLINAVFMCILGIGVALGSISVGAILSTALLIGPASCGLILARRVRDAIITAGVLGFASVWIGVILSYESYHWTGGKSWSVSFCIVALILLMYLVCRVLRSLGLVHGNARRKAVVAHV
ncbi:metal ABC transporter permease [Bifidobacterium aquikefiri]|uniref:metal ABC transporter permease n=1 Tax=Bifidobacterium aquikefiri TaxID=1653207 RepID=UPI0039E7E2A5